MGLLAQPQGINMSFQSQLIGGPSLPIPSTHLANLIYYQLLSELLLPVRYKDLRNIVILHTHTDCGLAKLQSKLPKRPSKCTKAPTAIASTVPRLHPLSPASQLWKPVR